MLGVSLRQAQRLATRYRDGGGGALIQKSRGRSASNKLGAGVRELVLELIRQNYRDFGPTFAAEMLQERHGVQVSRETLRKWMVEARVWLSRKQGRSFHQPRLRRESLGQLVQIEAVPYRIHTVLTDNGIRFADLPKNRHGPTARFRGHPFDRLCFIHGIEQRLTKPNHPGRTARSSA